MINLRAVIPACATLTYKSAFYKFFVAFVVAWHVQDDGVRNIFAIFGKKCDRKRKFKWDDDVAHMSDPPWYSTAKVNKSLLGPPRPIKEDTGMLA